MAKVLVTGAGGFAGSHIARYLQNEGHMVIGTIRHKTADFDFPVTICDLAESIDLDGDFDMIVHCAGSLPYKETDFRKFKRNNIDVMEQLIRFAVRKGIRRVIYLSTIGVYGEFRKETVTEETDIINPDAYGLTKYVAECMLRAEPSIESISLRMPGIIGPRSRGVWLTNTVEKFRRGETVAIYSPQFRTRNFVWIQDLAKFIERLIEMAHWKYDVVNVACAERIGVGELVDEIKHRTKSESRIVIGKSNRRPFCLDDKRVREMGYMAIEPREIVRQFVDSTENI